MTAHGLPKRFEWLHKLRAEEELSKLHSPRGKELHTGGAQRCSRWPLHQREASDLRDDRSYWEGQHTGTTTTMWTGERKTKDPRCSLHIPHLHLYTKQVSRAAWEMMPFPISLMQTDKLEKIDTVTPPPPFCTLISGPRDTRVLWARSTLWLRAAFQSLLPRLKHYEKHFFPRLELNQLLSTLKIFTRVYLVTKLQADWDTTRILNGVAHGYFANQSVLWRSCNTKQGGESKHDKLRSKAEQIVWTQSTARVAQPRAVQSHLVHQTILP